jgi:cholesterol oxidase
VNRFIANPNHEAAAEGYVHCDALGGRLPVETGVFNLFVHADDPTRKKMLYRLLLKNVKGEKFTLSGYKDIQDDPGLDVWQDTTTLFTTIYRGHVTEAKAQVIAAGIIHIHLLDFLRQLTTFKVEGPTLADRAAAMTRFGQLFLGSLWDVYAREVLAYGPF